MAARSPEPEKNEVDEILEIIDDPEFDEWAHLVNSTDPVLSTVSPHDTDTDLPVVKP